MIDATAKTHLVSSLGSLSGGRPNMFLEKQISNAFALPAGSKEANLAKLEILETLNDMEKIQLDNALGIAEDYESRGKPLPGKIQRMALKQSMPAIEKRQKQSAYRIQEYIEPPEGSPALQELKDVPKGTPLTRKKAAAILRELNPSVDPENPTEEEVQNAMKIAKGLGYNIHAFDIMEE